MCNKKNLIISCSNIYHYCFNRELTEDYTQLPHYKDRNTEDSKMLASSEASLSPKAKVSYDDGEFAVEIPLRDYKVCTYF